MEPETAENLNDPKFTPLDPGDVTVLTPSDINFSELLKVDPVKFKELQKSDETLIPLWKTAELDPAEQDSNKQFFIENELLYRKPQGMGTKPFLNPQLVLPKKCRESVMETAHSNAWAGHLGKAKTQSRILSQFYWPRIFEDVTNFVQSCLTCQKKW